MFDTGPLNDAMVDDGIFGQAANIITDAGSISLQIVWDIQHAHEGDIYEVTYANYVAGCRESDVAEVCNGDTLVVNSKNYRILAMEEDGQGWVNLIVEPKK